MGMDTRMMVTGDGSWAGESSRKPRRPRPYSRALRGGHGVPLCALNSSAPSPHQRRTNAVPTPYQLNCILGFRAEIRGCSDDGTALVRRW